MTLAFSQIRPAHRQGHPGLGVTGAVARGFSR